MGSVLQSGAFDGGERSAGRVGAILLGLSIAIVAWHGLGDVAAPWGYGYRDFSAGRWSAFWALHHLQPGLACTHGIPVETFAVDPANGASVPCFNWHHPPLYALYLAGCAWLFGYSEAVLRIAQLLLFLVALPATYDLLRRRCDALVGGVAVLLLASSPFVVLFGPMVLQDGAVLSFGLATAAAFQAYLDQPSRRRWVLVAALLFLTVSLDIPGYFWGPALLLMALTSERRRQGVLAVLLLFPVTVTAFLLMALHYGTVLGGPLGFVRTMLGLAGQEGGILGGRTFGEALAFSMHGVAKDLGAGGIVCLAVFGVVAGSMAKDAVVRRLFRLGLALCVPGLCNYLLFPGHALSHAFWALLLVGALPPLAVIVPLLGWRNLRAPALPVRILGLCMLTVTAGVIGLGLVQTPAVLAREARLPAGIDSLERLRPLLAHHPVVLTNLFDWAAFEKYRRDRLFAGEVPIGSTLIGPDGKQLTWTTIGKAALFGGIDSVEALQLLLAMARQNGIADEVTFLLAADPPSPELEAYLVTLAKPTREGDLQVFCFQVGGR